MSRVARVKRLLAPTASVVDRRIFGVGAVAALAELVVLNLEVAGDAHRSPPRNLSRPNDSARPYLLSIVDVRPRQDAREERVLDHPDPEGQRDAAGAEEPGAVVVELDAEPVLAGDEVVGGVVVSAAARSPSGT